VLPWTVLAELVARRPEGKKGRLALDHTVYSFRAMVVSSPAMELDAPHNEGRLAKSPDELRVTRSVMVGHDCAMEQETPGF
jgi:hypothetical protein